VFLSDTVTTKKCILLYGCPAERTISAPETSNKRFAQSRNVVAVLRYSIAWPQSNKSNKHTWFITLQGGEWGWDTLTGLFNVNNFTTQSDGEICLWIPHQRHLFKGNFRLTCL
jgi:hypothetical protein